MRTQNFWGRIFAGTIVLGCCFFCPSLLQAQIYLVEDINPGAGGTYVFRAGALGDAIYFSAFDGVYGEELWVSDGTSAGTYLVKDIWPDTNYDETGAYASKPEHFMATSAGMYFGASHREDPDNPPNHDYQLWFSTGVAGNASPVSSLDPALGTMSVAGAVVFDNQLFIAGWDETYGIELWKVSGTTASRLTDIEPGIGGSDPGFLTVVGGQLFFTAANSATSGVELWVTDGTAGGEHLIDIVEGIPGSYPSYITSFDGEAYFSAATEADGTELWASDGTEPGTRMVVDIASGYNASSDPLHLVPVGDQLFFTADDGTGRELWVTDGTTTQKIDGGYSSIWEAVAFDGRLFYTNSHPDSGLELWVSDGTPSGTELLVDVFPGTYTIGEDEYPNSAGVAQLTVAGGFLLFTADDGVHGPSLWVTDGTPAGTVMVANLFDFWSEEGPKGLTATTDRLFFQTEADLGREVHALPTLNVVSQPSAPTGEASGSTETAYTYTTAGGSVSLKGGDIQYRFNWGDEESTDWLDIGVKSADHTWDTDATYEVTVEARSSTYPSITSNESAPLSVVMSFSETIDASITSGPDTGEIWVEYDFSVTGESTYGHDMEFRVDWGGGEATGWSAFNAATGETITHDWDDLGEYEIVVTIRCTEHTTEAADAASHWITIGEETIDPPSIDGPTTGEAGLEYDFTIGGGSSAGHDLEYFVNWADGTDTGWLPFADGENSATASHSWNEAETFPIETCVRCSDHSNLQSCTYGTPIVISEAPEETIEGLDVSGSTNGYVDVSYGFTLSASSSRDHTLEYRVDWGDGEVIDWQSFGSGVTSVGLAHAWDYDDTHSMQFSVRCTAHPGITGTEIIEMFIDPEVVSDISLTGPVSGVAGASYDYTLTAHSASGHAMEYQIYWGHGDGPGPDDWFDIDPVTGSSALSHSWPIDGQDHNYQVDFGVRCKTHNNVQEWSSIWVSIPGETITNHTLEGPSDGLVGVDYEFTVTGTSPDGHSLEYKFDWGDGFPTDWAPLSGGTATPSYHWAGPGVFKVTSSIRCATHNHVVSEQELLVTIATGTPPGWIFGDDFESGNTGAW